MYGFKSKHKIGLKDLRKMLVQNLRKKQGKFESVLRGTIEITEKETAL